MKKTTAISWLAVLVLFFAACGGKDEGGDSTLLENSFDRLGTYPVPDALVYVSIDGTSCGGKVFPGQIVVLTDGATADQVSELVQAQGGEIVAQVPNAGLYCASVDPAATQDLLDALYASPLVVDAFPNRFVLGKGFASQCGTSSVAGDKNSLVQTIDLSADMGCPNNFYHKDAVAAVASQNNVSTNINDVTVYSPGTDSAGSDTYKSLQKMLELLNYAHDHDQPVVINISMGGNDYIQDDDYYYCKKFAWVLQAVEKQNPHLLDNAVIFMSGPDVSRNETAAYQQLQNDFPGSPIWDHLYFVGSQEGATGCGMGYADNGTPNYLAGPACDITTGPGCTVSGNSFSVPFVGNLVAQVQGMLQQSGIDMTMPEITEKLWDYQKLHNGALPTATTLYNLCAGLLPDEVDYSGTWSGTFYYKATVPQESGPPEIINTSFILTFTMESVVAIQGQPHYLNITAVTCSDPSFGATMVVAPVQGTSIALLPATYGSTGDYGMGFMIEFPNGSHVASNNTLEGSFTIDEWGTVLTSTDAVLNEAFFAGGTGENSNEPGSGPGGYAYNWCTFKNWSLTRQ